MPSELAPLQILMLRDSLAEARTGAHVEQVEIVFREEMRSGRVVSAWEKTVAETEALRIAFLTDGGEPAGWEFVAPSSVLQRETAPPVSWEAWFHEDRLRPLLAPHQVPWRAVWWPCAGRFVWTFHHALLDGRSITEVLRGFLIRLAGGTAPRLAVSRWCGPSQAMLELAERWLRESFANLAPLDLDWLPADSNENRAVSHPGMDFAARLGAAAAAMTVTTATVLTYAWGRALAEAAGTGDVLIEQVRCGPPRGGTAGFTMNTLPVLVPRADGDAGENLRRFREQLLALRGMEAVSHADFPPGVFPDMNGPWSSVIMIERGTLDHLAGVPDFIGSLALHEGRGETLMATAYLLPDLRLEVEGPQRHFLLARWIRELEKLAAR